MSESAIIVGIDEAGYGPNLGPFVMTLVACHVPSELFGTNLWTVLKRGVRGPDERKDDLLYKSTRNIHGADALPTSELNAENILRHENLIISENALNALAQRLAAAQGGN